MAARTTSDFDFDFTIADSACRLTPLTSSVCRDPPRTAIHGTDQSAVLMFVAAQVITVCGSGKLGFVQGKCLTEARLAYPQAVCTDPLRPFSFFVGDSTSIRYVDTESDTVSLFAGSQTEGDATDGIGSATAFRGVSDLVCTSGGDAIDYGNRCIRSVEVKSRAVTTVVGGGGSLHGARNFTFDRSGGAIGLESVLYITSASCITRLAIPRRELSTCSWHDEDFVRGCDFHGIGAVPCGRLILSCSRTHSLYLYDPVSGKHSLLAGGMYARTADGSALNARFSCPNALGVVENECCLYVNDLHTPRLRRVTLPPPLLFSYWHVVEFTHISTEMYYE